MARGPAVLMLDDGELDDIQELLDDIGVAYARIRGGAIVDGQGRRIQRHDPGGPHAAQACALTGACAVT